MLFSKVIQESDPDYPKLLSLYEAAFPDNERLAPNRYTEREGNEFIAFYIADEEPLFAGFAWMLTKGDLSHILYFAIEPALRHEGLGTEALRCLQGHFPGKRIIADVEDPDTNCPDPEERRRRIRFYERAGYRLTDIRYLWQNEFYLMMVQGGTLTREEFSRFWEGDEENAVAYQGKA